MPVKTVFQKSKRSVISQAAERSVLTAPANNSLCWEESLAGVCSSVCWRRGLELRPLIQGNVLLTQGSENVVQQNGVNLSQTFISCNRGNY